MSGHLYISAEDTWVAYVRYAKLLHFTIHNGAKQFDSIYNYGNTMEGIGFSIHCHPHMVTLCHYDGIMWRSWEMDMPIDWFNGGLSTEHYVMARDFPITDEKTYIGDFMEFIDDYARIEE